MTRKRVVLVWAIVAVLLFLFPHFVLHIDAGTKLGMGWGFVFSGPSFAFPEEFSDERSVVTIDTGLLAVMELVVAGIAVAAYFAAKKT